MKTRYATTLAALLVLAGCGKKETVAAPEPDDAMIAAPSEAPVAPDAPYPTAAVPSPARPTPIDGLVHPFMTEQLHIFVRERGRMPKDFSEFASARMDSVPAAPPGTQYVVDQTTAQVKLVRIQ